MTVEQQIVEKIRTLSPEKQQQVLELVEEITKTGSRKTERSTQPLRNVHGLWKDYGMQITEEDIAEARREMWGNFPRPLPE